MYNESNKHFSEGYSCGSKTLPVGGYAGLAGCTPTIQTLSARAFLANDQHGGDDRHNRYRIWANI